MVFEYGTYVYYRLGSEFIDNDVLNNYFRLMIDNFNDIG